MFSVGSKEEAEALLVATCPRDSATGEYVARELVQEQTLENLAAFGQRLADIHDRHFKGTHRCTCA